MTTPTRRFDRSLRYHLDKIHAAQIRESIIKKFRIVLDFNDEVDSDPMDSFRLIGKLTIRIQLLEELNKFVTEQTSNYSSLKIWVKELYELRELFLTQLSLGTEMARALVSRGFLDGLYRVDSCVPSATTCYLDTASGMCGAECTYPKPTTAKTA
jgi:hypothetical protein